MLREAISGVISADGRCIGDRWIFLHRGLLNCLKWVRSVGDAYGQGLLHFKVFDTKD